MLGRIIQVLSLAAVLSGCEDPLKRAQLLEEPRVIGVRLSGNGDLATLEPDEPATLAVLVATPGGVAEGARLAFQLCEAAPNERGVPSCAGEPLVEGTGAPDGSPIPFMVPAEAMPGAMLALLGVVCVTGEPELAPDPFDWSCDDGSEPLRLSFDGHMGDDDFVNANPELSDLQILIGDESLPIDTPIDCDGETPTIAREQAHQIEVTLGDAAREPGELLQLSHFASAGTLERHYSFVEPAQAMTTSLSFTPPSDAGFVHQYLVVRDGRGGVSWASFGFCLP